METFDERDNNAIKAAGENQSSAVKTSSAVVVANTTSTTSSKVVEEKDIIGSKNNKKEIATTTTKKKNKKKKGGPLPNDVITLKGAAAQQTTHPGNLFYYKLCEEKFAEFDSLDPNTMVDERRNICIDIISKVKNNGGIFYDLYGKPMKLTSTIAKTQNRMRQIKRPKQVPPPRIGNNDVVFKQGAANHLFPGNAKWRALLDKYIIQYWPQFAPPDDDPTTNTTPAPATGAAGAGADDDDDQEQPKMMMIKKEQKRKYFHKRPEYQLQVAKEIINIIHERGGKFRGGMNLKELTEKEVLIKIHERFKDIKKYILQGKMTIDGSKEGQYNIKKTGCTSVQSTFLYGQKKPPPSSSSVAAATTSKKMKNKKLKSNTVSLRQKLLDLEEMEEQEQDISFDSESDDSDDDDENEDEEMEGQGEYYSSDEEEKLVRRSKQAQAREERMKRRAAGITAPKSSNNNSDGGESQTKKRRQRKRKVEQESPKEEPDLSKMSDYERLRYEKMKRNEQRLAQLGLLRSSYPNQR